MGERKTNENVCDAYKQNTHTHTYVHICTGQRKYTMHASCATKHIMCLFVKIEEKQIMCFIPRVFFVCLCLSRMCILNGTW